MNIQVLVIAGLVLSLAACGNQRASRQVAFDEQIFRASLSRDRDDRRAFSISVREPGKSLAGAREAGRYEATKYCVEQFGSSRVEWAQGPDVEDAELVLTDGILTFVGRCKD